MAQLERNHFDVHHKVRHILERNLDNFFSIYFLRFEVDPFEHVIRFILGSDSWHTKSIVAL